MPILKTESDRERYIVFLLVQDLPYKVDGSAYKPSRSNEQNNYLFGPCYEPIMDATGFEKADLHEFFCGTVFGWVDRKVPKTPRNPEGVESVPRRTTTTNEHGKRDTLDKGEFSKFVDFVHRFASQRGIYISEAWNEA